MNLTTKKNWKTVKLGDVALQMFSGGTPSSQDKSFYGGDIPWLRTQEVTFNYIYETELKITEEGFKNSSTKWVPPNNVIIAMYGNSAGRVAYSTIPLTTNQACCNIVADTEKINSKFLYFLLKGQYKKLENMATGGAQQNLSVGVLKDYEIKIPESIDEQREVAGVLGCLDDKIELLRKENKTLEEMAQTLFKEWFVNFNFHGATGRMIDSELGEIPEGWRLGKLYDLVNVMYGFPFKSEFFNEENIGMPLIRIRDLKDGSPAIYTNEDCGSQYVIKRGDIVAGMDAEFRPSIWVGHNGVLNQRVCKFTPKNVKVSNYFVYWLVKPHLEFFEKTKGGTTVSHLGKSDLDSIEVVVPATDILEKFSDVVDTLFCKTVNNFSEIQTLSKSRDQLLDKIFN